MYPDAIEKLALPQWAPAARGAKSPGWSWLAVPSVLVLLIVWTRCEYPLDYWLHVNSGRWIVRHGQQMELDPFSHTIAGQPIDNQPWLAQVAMFGMHQFGGYALAQFAAGLAYAGSLFLVVWIAFRRTGDARAAGVLGCLAAALMATNLGVRPQMFSAMLFALQLFVLSRWRSVVAVTAASGLLAALWTNLHGAYPLGIVLCALFAGRGLIDGYQYQVWRPMGRAVAALGAFAVGCLVRPDPASTLSYVLGVSSRSATRQLEEWLPTSVVTASGPPLIAAVLVVLAVLAISRRRLHLGDLALLAVFLLPAFLTQRMVIWWAMVLPLTLAPALRSAWKYLEARTTGTQAASAASRPLPRRAGWAIAAGLLIFGSLCTPWTRAYNPLLPPGKRRAIAPDEPHQAAQFLARQKLGGRLYSPMPWGSYFSWHSDGRLRTFVDSRVDFFPDDVWRDYLAIASGDSASERLIGEYGIEIVVCDRRTDHQLIDCLARDPAWRTIHGDPLAQVFARCPPKSEIADPKSNGGGTTKFTKATKGRVPQRQSAGLR